MILLAVGCASEPEAELVLKNGAVYTVDEARPWVEATRSPR